ncbi:MAG: hypothetical protein N3D11_02900 [Candidatus Sumerlaeia bacterium]|nr:hypothetical protein [Candidatus Sumerlaeia bacterium]
MRLWFSRPTALSSQSPQPTPDGGFQTWAWPAASVPPLVFTALTVWWYFHCPQTLVFLGYLQGDQPAYTALARAVLQRGNGLFYANPFDFDPAAPRVLTNFGYILLGGLIRLAGDKTAVAWEIWRLGWGVLCYGLFARIVARLFAATALRWWVYCAGLFGGGAAWILTLAIMAARPEAGWLRAFVEAEKGYDWWCLNLFRQSLYPLELAYHALFFGAVLSCLNRWRGVLLLGIFLVWWTHPITAILTTTTVGLSLLSDWMDGRRRSDLWTLAGVAAVAAAWAAYYRLYLPQFPSVRSWIEQTLSFHFPLRGDVWPRAWGLLLAGVPAALLYRPLRLWLFGQRDGRLVLFWGAAVLVWSHNDRFLPQPIQPIHFLRGYLFLFLLILTAKAAELMLMRRQAERPASEPVAADQAGKKGSGGKRHRVGIHALAGGVVVLLSLDNVLFVARVATETPQLGLLTISPAAKAVLDFYSAKKESKGILSADRHLGVLLVAHTRHRLFLSEAVLTPFFSERAFDAAQMLRDGGRALARQQGIEEIVLWKTQGAPFPAWAHDPAQFRVVFENELYRVGKVDKAADVDATDGMGPTHGPSPTITSTPPSAVP